MEEEKIQMQKPHTSFNRRHLLLKNPDGNMTTVKKNVKNFILQGGEHDKGGNMAKGITVVLPDWRNNKKDKGIKYKI